MDYDPVAVLRQADRPAPGGFGRNVAAHEAVGRAGEAAVGDQGNVVAEAAASNGSGNSEHLAHAGTANGSLSANHDHVAGLDPAMRHCVECCFLAVKHLCRAFETQL